jgi:hypothetical protein
MTYYTTFINFKKIQFKKVLIIALMIPLLSACQASGALSKVLNDVNNGMSNPNVIDISGGLKQALNRGISDQVVKLTALDGFYGNTMVKILMPQELQSVERTLRSLGLGKLADDGIKSLNRAAEDAAKEAAPIFINAIKKMKINDAKNILLGNENAATTYFQGTTSSELYQKINPVVQKSLGKVGADVLWKSLITKYNTLPLTADVNPDINDYVTQKTLEGIFKMIAVEEKNIRTNLNARTTSLLKQVFAMQDKK